LSKPSSGNLKRSPEREDNSPAEIFHDFQLLKDEISKLKEELTLKDSLIARMESEILELRRNNELHAVSQSRILKDKSPPKPRQVPKVPSPDWTVDDMVNFLSNHPVLHSYSKLFRDEEIDGLTFLSLDENDFAQMNLTIGARKNLLKLIEETQGRK